MENDDRLGDPVGVGISGQWNSRICTQTGRQVHERSARTNKHESWADWEVEGDDELNDPSSDDISKYWSQGSSSSIGTSEEMGDNSSFRTPTGNEETGDGREPRLAAAAVEQLSRTRKKILNKTLAREHEVQGNLEPQTGTSSSNFMSPNHILFQGSDNSSPTPPTTSSSEVGDVGDGGSSIFDAEEKQEKTPLGFPSVGSALHENGHCKPCVFFRSTAKCHKGIDCTFCHLQHKRSNHPRPSKSKRSWFKRLIERPSENGVEDADSRALDFSPPSAAPELPTVVRSQGRAPRRPDARAGQPVIIDL